MPDNDNTASILEELVGPGKKFATVDDLARGKVEADAFIEQLKQEKQGVLEALQEAEKGQKEQVTIADLIKAVRDPGDKPKPDADQHKDEGDLQEKIRSIMKREEAEQTRKANRERGNTLVLQKAQGNAEAAKALVAERAEKLGLTPDKLVELSELSPTAFAKVMEIDLSNASKGTASLPKHNSEFQDQGVRMEVDGRKTKAFYDKLKKEMGPGRYYGDAKVQLAYLKDAQALGEKFNT